MTGVQTCALPISGAASVGRLSIDVIGSSDRFHVEAGGCLAAAVALDHRREGAFEMARRACRVEQRESPAVARQLLFRCGKGDPVGREPEGKRFVFRKRLGDELGQTNRGQQAGGDAAGETGAFAGDQRKPGPKGVAGGRVRIVGKGVQEQVGEAMARQVIGRPGALRRPRGLIQPVSISTSMVPLATATPRMSSISARVVG